MKKLAMLAAVLLGTAAASQAGVNVHIGIPLPPLPRVVFGHPAPVVVAPGHWAHCAPIHGGNYRHHPHHHRHVVHGHHGYAHWYRCYDHNHAHGRKFPHGSRHGHR